MWKWDPLENGKASDKVILRQAFERQQCTKIP